MENDHSDPVNRPWLGLKMRRGSIERVVLEVLGRGCGAVVSTRATDLSDGSHWITNYDLLDWSKWAAGTEVVK